jgi:exonuclease III
MLRDKINNKKNDSKQVKSHKKRTTNKIKRKWRTIFNFGWVDMFSKANREMEGGGFTTANCLSTHCLHGCASMCTVG